MSDTEAQRKLTSDALEAIRINRSDSADYEVGDLEMLVHAMAERMDAEKLQEAITEVKEELGLEI